MNKSETITKLASALAKFNGEISKIAKDANNPFFKNKYATLDNIIDEARPVLTKNGLSIMQLPAGDGEFISISTLLLHESGEWLESDPLIMKPGKNDPQSLGSCITYMRRYSLSSVLSLNTGEDDDGNKATFAESTQRANPAPPRNEPTRPAPTTPPKDYVITEAQAKRLFAISKQKGIPSDELKAKLAGMGFNSSKDLTKGAYDKVCQWAEQYIKQEPEITFDDLGTYTDQLEGPY